MSDREKTEIMSDETKIPADPMSDIKNESMMDEEQNVPSAIADEETVVIDDNVRKSVPVDDGEISNIEPHPIKTTTPKENIVPEILVDDANVNITDAADDMDNLVIDSNDVTNAMSDDGRLEEVLSFPNALNDSKFVKRTSTLLSSAENQEKRLADEARLENMQTIDDNLSYILPTEQNVQMNHENTEIVTNSSGEVQEPLQNDDHMEQIVPGDENLGNAPADEEAPVNEVIDEETPANELMDEEVPVDQAIDEEVPTNEVIDDDVPTNDVGDKETPVNEPINDEQMSNVIPNNNTTEPLNNNDNGQSLLGDDENVEDIEESPTDAEQTEQPTGDMYHNEATNITTDNANKELSMIRGETSTNVFSNDADLLEVAGDNEKEADAAPDNENEDALMNNDDNQDANIISTNENIEDVSAVNETPENTSIDNENPAETLSSDEKFADVLPDDEQTGATVDQNTTEQFIPDGMAAANTLDENENLVDTMGDDQQATNIVLTDKNNEATANISVDDNAVQDTIPEEEKLTDTFHDDQNNELLNDNENVQQMTTDDKIVEDILNDEETTDPASTAENIHSPFNTDEPKKLTADDAMIDDILRQTGETAAVTVPDNDEDPELLGDINNDENSIANDEHETDGAFDNENIDLSTNNNNDDDNLMADHEEVSTSVPIFGNIADSDNVEKVKDEIPVDEQESSVADSPNMDKLTTNNKVVGNMSIDEEKLSNMGSYDLTLTDVLLNDEQIEAMADGRSLHRMRTSARKPTNPSISEEKIADEIPSTENEEEKDLLTSNIQTEAKPVNTDETAANVPSRETKQGTDTMLYDGDRDSLINSDSEEISMINDKKSKNPLSPIKQKTSPLIDDGDDNDSWAFPNRKLPKVPLKPHRLQPIGGGASVGKLPVNVAATPKLSVTDGKLEELLSDADDDGDKIMNWAKRSPTSRNLLIGAKGRKVSVGNIGSTTNALPLKKPLSSVLSEGRQRTNTTSAYQGQGPNMSRRNTEHTIVDLSKLADVTPDHEPMTSSTMKDDSLTFFTNSKNIGNLAVNGESIEKTNVSQMKAALPMTKGASSDSLINMEKSDDTMNSFTEGKESTSFLGKVNVSRSDDGRLGSNSSSGSADRVAFENETLGSLNANGRKSVFMIPGRKTNRLSFVESAHVIQIHSSKESHMRALPSEKFWRRNQRRVSTMPTAEEAQAVKR